jgi:zinc protease
MLKFALLLLLQVVTPPQGEIVGPFTFREDQGQTTKVILKNGLTVIVREQHATPLVSITTHVKAGYFDEEDRISGISHVIEHMFFKGTATRPVGEVARETKALGGTLNAYTSYDRTVFYTIVPADNALAALDIQADALWHSSFDSAELKREIEVVLQENNRKLDNPSAVASEKLYATGFTEHRMKRWRIGTAEGLRALTRDDLVAYYKKFYQPSNIVLTIVGAIDREKAFAEIVKLYGGQENTPVQRDAVPPEPAQTEMRWDSQRGPMQESRVAVGYHTPGVLADEARTLEVLATILGTGRSSRLNQYLRDQKNVISSGSSHIEAFRDFSYFEIDVQTSTNLEAALAVLAEVENIKRSGVTNEAVARAKAAIAQDYYGRQETVDGTGDELAYYEALGDWKRMTAYLGDIQKVTPQRIQDAARKYLVNENLSIFEYLNTNAPRAVSLDDYRKTVVAKVEAAVERRNETELPVSAQIPTTSSQGATLVADIAGTVKKQSILRGPDVYILEDHRLPIVSFGIFFPGGRLLETDKNAGITELMLRSALRGTNKSDSAGIARRLENAGARIQVVNEPDFFGYVLEGLSGQMPQALQVLIEVLQQPAFEEEFVKSERALQLARLQSLRDDNNSYPVSLFMKTLFGDAPYARPAIGTEEAVGKLTGVDLLAWFRNNERKILPTIVIVGDARGTGLIAPITESLTNEDLEPLDVAAMSKFQLPRQTQETIEPATRQQTAMVYGFPGVPRASNDRYTMELFADMVSGLGGRFFDAIREKQGLAYSVRTSNVFNTRGGAVFTYTAFSPEKEADVRSALAAEYEKLRKDGVTADELHKAMEFAIGDHDIGLQTRGAQVLEYARAVYSGAGYQSVARYEAAISAVTPEQMKKAFEQYLDPAGLRIGVVRGSK